MLHHDHSVTAALSTTPSSTAIAIATIAVTATASACVTATAPQPGEHCLVERTHQPHDRGKLGRRHTLGTKQPAYELRPALRCFCLLRHCPPCLRQRFTRRNHTYTRPGLRSKCPVNSAADGSERQHRGARGRVGTVASWTHVSERRSTGHDPNNGGRPFTPTAIATTVAAPDSTADTYSRYFSRWIDF